MKTEKILRSFERILNKD